MFTRPPESFKASLDETTCRYESTKTNEKLGEQMQLRHLPRATFDMRKILVGQKNKPASNALW